MISDDGNPCSSHFSLFFFGEIFGNSQRYRVCRGVFWSGFQVAIWSTGDPDDRVEVAANYFHFAAPWIVGN